MHNLYEAIPFVGVILSIALVPLFAQHFWERHSKKVLSSWILLYISMEVFLFGMPKTATGVFESIVKHYIPFVILVSSLFITTGGIFVAFNRVKQCALTNTIFLFCSSMIAGWIGTTGASALLIRPFLRLNEGRKSKVHLVLFFIFLVSNIGGLASPIGDPPLFMGYLEGIRFFWFIQHMFLHLLFTVLVLCVIFFAVDKYLWRRNDKNIQSTSDNVEQDRIIVIGKRNIVFLFMILLSLVLLNTNDGFSVFGTKISYTSVIRDTILVLISYLSIKYSPKLARLKNEFSYAPVIEVAETFVAIFITVHPLLEMLSLGENGPLGSVFSAISVAGRLDPFRCFWTVGALSSFLDNAPTFLIFFYLAGGNAADLMLNNTSYLIAISIGAVFMGAVTYIGNAPNLMMKSVAISAGIQMPSFIKYTLLAICILLPVFAILSLVL